MHAQLYKTNNEKIMKKNTLSALSLAIVVMAILFVASCSGDKKIEAVRDTTVDSLQKVIDQKDNELNDFVGVFNEIQEGFRLIEVAENNVSVIRDGENTNKADQIRESIRNIQQRMQHNRELIENLQKKLREGTLRSEELQKTITNFMKQLDEKNIELEQLRVELERKDIHIAELDQTVADLNANVSDLKEETEQKAQVIDQQDKQLNTAYYVFGTKKELQEQNVLHKGKVLQGNFNKNYFTKIDIRVDKEIKLYSKKAELLTSHPAGSYTLKLDAQQQYVLRITDPQKFWGASKYLVVLVK